MNYSAVIREDSSIEVGDSIPDHLDFVPPQITPVHMLECKILTTESAVTAIYDEWRELHIAYSKIPYTAPGWFNAWWQNIGKPKGKTLAIFTGWVNGKLVAVLPLSINNKKGLRFLQGVGTEASSYCDVLSEFPEYTKPMWEAVRASDLYDFAIIRDVACDSVSSQALSIFAQQGQIDKVLILNIKWNDSKAWLADFHTNLRRNNNRLMRKLQEKGEVKYFTETGHPISTHILDEMIDHKIVWAKEHKIFGLFDLPGLRGFYHQLAVVAADRKKMHMSWLVCGEERVAYSMGFIHDDTVYLKMISNNPDYLPYSPGNQIFVSAVSWAIDNGYRAVNFGIGDNHYKLRYANDTKSYCEWIFSRTIKGHLAIASYLAFRSARAKIKTIKENFETNIVKKMKTKFESMRSKSPAQATKADLP